MQFKIVKEFTYIYRLDKHQQDSSLVYSLLYWKDEGQNSYWCGCGKFSTEQQAVDHAKQIKAIYEEKEFVL